MNINAALEYFTVSISLAQVMGVASAVEITSARSYDILTIVPNITLRGDYGHVYGDAGV